jgi:hypothetical protein
MRRRISAAAAALVVILCSAARADEGGGLKWSAPAAWKKGPDRPMRLATYSIPAAKGDAAAAELAVFYFGPAEGGSVDANVQRWIGQFEQAAGEKPKIEKQSLHGLPATRIEVSGTYNAGGPMMGGGAPRPDHRLIGVIVEGPKGNVFFKLTGPRKTVTAANKELRGLLASIQPIG